MAIGYVPLLAVLMGGMAWAALHSTIYFDADAFLPRDNFNAHFPLFDYVARYVRETGHFPAWDYSASIGMSLAPLANNHLLLLPHRIFGVFLVAQGVSPALAYKVSFLVVGQGLFFLGVYLFVSRFLKSGTWGATAVIVGLVSGVGVGMLHQEQVLGTVFYVPFLWWCAIEERLGKYRWPLFAALLGLAMNAHYPQLLLLYGLVVGGGLLLTLRPNWKSLRFSSLGLAVAVFLISASPVLFSYTKFRNELASPFRRQKESVTARTYAEYRDINDQDYSSVHPRNFRFYLGVTRDRGTSLGILDENALFLTYVLPLALVLSFFLPLPFRAFHWATILGLSVLSLGTYGPMPRALWPWFPGIGLFRQWYHFVPLLNLHLLFLLVLVASSLKRFRGAYVAVSILGSLPWTLYAINKVEDRLVRGPAIPEGAAFFDMRHLNLVLPRGIDHARALKWFPAGAMHWVSIDGEVIPARPGDIEAKLTSSGLVLKTLAGWETASSLMLMQHADGDWRISEAGRATPLLTERQNDFVEVPIDQRAHELLFERRQSPWSWFVLAMWAPLAVLMASYLWSHLRLPVLRPIFRSRQLRS